MLVPISEYAKIHGKSRKTVQQKCQRGGFVTAVKMGRDWMIERDEPYTDLRCKHHQEIAI